MVEEEITCVVRIGLDLAAILVWVCDRIIEQLDEHGEVVGELWSKALLLTHLLEFEHIDHMLVQEEEILFAENLELEHLWALVGPPDQYLDELFSVFVA